MRGRIENGRCRNCGWQPEPLIHSVLPPVPPSGLTDIDDLLTDEQRRQLYDDLAALAALRRRVEAESAHIIIGGG